jgi:hypothetical protein
MFSLTIVELQEIVPKLIALHKGWFKHARDFGRFASLRTKKIETWPSLYIAMGYKMPKHASLSHFSPYFLLFERHPIPPSSIAAQMDQVVDLDSPTTWAKVIAERVALFRRVMPMAMENLSIAQH